MIRVEINRLLLALAISVILFFATKSNSNPDLRTMQPSHKEQVVRIEADSAVCTGVIVAKNRIATAAHCFGYPRTIRNKVTVVFEDGRTDTGHALKIGDPNSPTDVAIVMVDTSNIEPLVLRPRAISGPDYCFFIGYGGDFGKNEMPCYASRLIKEKNRDLIEVLGPIIPGDSGGPVLGRRGEVIGIVFAYTDFGSKGLAIPSWTIKEFLEAARPPQSPY